jgi:hypothetical protein
VIGTALADNSSLKQQNLKLIAVLSVPPPPSTLSRSTSTASLRGVGDNCSLVVAARKESSGRRCNQGHQKVNSSIDEEEDWILQDASPVLATPPTLATSGSATGLPSLLLDPSVVIPASPPSTLA